MTRRSAQAGFTLVEILIALTMVATIVSMVYGSYVAATDSAQGYRQKSAALQKVHLALDQLAAQIRCVYVPEDFRPDTTKARPSPPSDAGTPDLRTQIPLLAGSGRRQGDILTLVTMKSVSPEQAKIQTRHATTLTFDRASGELVLSQRPYGETVRQEPQEGRHLVLADCVTQVTLAYYDGSQWQNNWDSRERHCLPRAVRCDLTIQDHQSRGYTNHSIIPIPCSVAAGHRVVKVTSR